jgi:hypothetical protein
MATENLEHDVVGTIKPYVAVGPVTASATHISATGTVLNANNKFVCVLCSQSGALPHLSTVQGTATGTNWNASFSGSFGGTYMLMVFARGEGGISSMVNV